MKTAKAPAAVPLRIKFDGGKPVPITAAEVNALMAGKEKRKFEIINDADEVIFRKRFKG